MKTIMWRLSIRTILLSSFACSIFAFGFAGVAHAQIVFHVDPSGDQSGEIDWVNVVQAFESAKAAGSSNVVELGEGTFIINKVIQVENFDGTFRGAGKGLTVVQNKYVEDERFPTTDFPLPAFATLFAFYATTAEERGGSADNPANIAISDMTLKEIGLPVPYFFHPSQGWVHTFGDFIYVAGRVVASTNEGTPAFINVSFANLEVIGEIDPSYPWGYNASYGLSTKGWLETTRTWVESEGGWIVEEDSPPVPISGTFTWSNCSFTKLETPIAVYVAVDSSVTISDIDASHVFWNGIHVWGMKSVSSTSTADVSDVVITNSAATMASYLVNSAVSFWDTSGAAVTISGVDTTNASGVYIDQADAEAPSTFVISHNDIDQSAYPSFAGIEIWDSQELASTFLVQSNAIHSEGVALWGPIWLWGTQQALIANNIITGNGPAAIYAGVDYWGGGSDNELTLLGNNVQGWDTEPSGFLPGVAPIWLGWATSNSTVVGNGKNVADDGINNSVTGMSNMGPVAPPDNLGQNVSAAQKRKRDFR